MIEESEGYGRSPLVDSVAEWLMEQALGDGEIKTIFAGCCRRLVAAGLPVSRVFLTYRTLHPLYASVFLIWQRGADEVRVREMLHEQAYTSEQWYQSPMHHMEQSGIPYLRRRLVGAEAVVDFEILEELRAEGGTDYLGFLVPFGDGAEASLAMDCILGSWSTDRETGFSGRDIRDLTRVQKRLAVACKVQIRREITRNVLSAYLGPDAGQQVLDGRIQRGDGRHVYAVVWYSDLRRSTELAETLTDDAYLELLNQYFECTAGAVMAGGGEVLRFIGDAVLAIFAVDASAGGKMGAAQLALAAASDARARMDDLNAARDATGDEPIKYGVGLHIGRVMYGNIGVPERVEFSVIGPAANEVARLEDLTKVLDRDVLVSEPFAALLPLAWEELGQHRMRGVTDAMAVFAPPDARSASASVRAVEA